MISEEGDENKRSLLKIKTDEIDETRCIDIQPSLEEYYYDDTIRSQGQTESDIDRRAPRERPAGTAGWRRAGPTACPFHSNEGG